MCLYWAMEVSIVLISIVRGKEYWITENSVELINIAKTQWNIGPQKFSGELFKVCLYWAIEISIGLISIVDQKNIESQKSGDIDQYVSTSPEVLQ